MSDFSHSGKYGDLIYAMPTIRALGGGKLWLHPDGNMSGHEFSWKDIDILGPLMLAQNYITDIALTESGNRRGHNLDLFRKHWRNGKPITFHHLKAFGLSDAIGLEKWIEVPRAEKIASVVFNVAFRWMTHRFPYKTAVDRWGKQAVFIGLECEHERFCKEFGEVEYHRTDDMLEAAQVINQSDLYIGSQSSCLALAQGLRKRCLIDYWPRDTCALRTAEQVVGWDGNTSRIDDILGAAWQHAQ